MFAKGLQDLDFGQDLSTCSNFTCMRFDAFDDCANISKRVQGGHVNSKHWAVIFTCMNTKAT